LTFLVLSGYPDRVEIRDSARKRGHQDSDMLHAVRHALAIFTVPGQDVTMYLGPAHSGTSWRSVSPTQTATTRGSSTA